MNKIIGIIGLTLLLFFTNSSLFGFGNRAVIKEERQKGIITKFVTISLIENKICDKLDKPQKYSKTIEIVRQIQNGRMSKSTDFGNTWHPYTKSAKTVEILVYPNPSNKQIKLSFDSEKDNIFIVSIFNIDGVKFNEFDYENDSQLIDIEYLPSGQYIISVKGENSNEIGHTKLIKQ